MNMNQLIIIGGGVSIKEGIQKDLWKKLENRFTCGINYSYRYFDSTYLCCMNYTDFYDTNREELKQLPLILMPYRPHPSNYEKNTLIVSKIENFRLYLSGIFALMIGILLKPKEIFLLGFDYGEIKNLTHFYQGKIKHRGIGKSQYYTPNHAERDFGIFEKEKKVLIYNVSLKSKINIFPKISYDKFFRMLDNNTYNQKKLVKQIRTKL